MEYLEGEPLLAVLRAGREGKRLDVLSTGRLIADTAEGLDAAHELRSMSGDRLELVHHDISLGNIVALYNGQVKLVDFGVAKATQSAGTKTKVQGKFSYMAPEKLKGAPGDRRSDIFSLGCVMWEALTLKRLFRGGNDAETMKQVLEMAIQPPSKINGEVPPEYDPIVMRALDRAPNRRHGTAKEMAVEIEELLRKRGYGAKNDKIARYMQDTFKAHIDARKKLVQEVVSKGSASAEILDAAFSEPIVASGSPVEPVGGGDFSLSYKRVDPPAPRLPPPPRRGSPAEGVPIPTDAWADASPRTQISTPPVHPMFDGSGTATEIAPLPDMSSVVDQPESKRRGPSIGDRVRALTDKVRPLAGRVRPLVGRARPLLARGSVQAKAILADKKKRLYVAAGAGVLLLLIIIIAIASGGDDKKAVAAGGGSGGEQHVVTGPGSDVVEQNGSGSANAADGSDDIVFETGSDHATGSNAGSATKPEKTEKNVKPEKTEKTIKTEKVEKVVKTEKVAQPRIDVVETVNEGLKAFVTGDTKHALALLKQAKAAKPGYAPTYRVLGKVYKKVGDNTSAKASFQRYLKLAPTAPDAEQIRKEMEEL